MVDDDDVVLRVLFNRLFEEAEAVFADDGVVFKGMSLRRKFSLPHSV